MKNFLYRFMAGRYGNDSFNKFLTGLWLGLAILHIIVDWRILLYLVWFLCFYVLFRTFSRNIPARQKENAWFWTISSGPKKAFAKLKGWFSLQKDRHAQRKTHRFFKCPSCGATLRVPRRKGMMNIRCVRCGTQFSRKIR